MNYEVSGNKAQALHKGYRADVVVHGDSSADRMLVHVYLEEVGPHGEPTDKLVKITPEPIEACSLDGAFAAGFETAELEIDKLTAP